MTWLFYILCSILFSHAIGLLSRNRYLYVFTIAFVFFNTPAQIDLSGDSLSPSFFTFMYNVLFERDISLRVLRPLIITLPIALIFVVIFEFFKKRFFPLKNNPNL